MNQHGKHGVGQRLLLPCFSFEVKRNNREFGGNVDK